MNYKYILKLCFFLITTYSFSQNVNVKDTRTSSLRFLMINTDARSAGQGDNGVATSADGNAIFHNPSKAIFQEKTSNIAVNYTPWLSNFAKDIHLFNISYIKKINKRNSFGIDFKYFSLGKIQLTELQGDNVIEKGTENPNELAVTGFYAMKLSKNYSMAVSLSYVNSNLRIVNLDTSSKVVNALTVGISGFYNSDIFKIDTYDASYRFGFNLSNLGAKVSYFEGRESFIPTNLKIGGGLDFNLNTKNLFSINLEISKLLIPYGNRTDLNAVEGIFDAIKTTSLKDFLIGFGLEYKFNKMFSFRGGYLYENEQVGYRNYITTGLGFKTKDIGLDLSYLVDTSKFDNSPLKNTFRISLTFDF